jgi:putative tryptophan/tyrosine transport system substrate-binding protein
MQRRQFIGLLGGAVAWPELAHSQTQARMIPTIGVLWHAGSEKEEAIYLGALREGFNSRGYVEGKTIVLENRFPAELPDRFASLGAELVQLKPDVLVAVTRPAASAIQRLTTTIPVVFTGVPDPVGSKLVTSLARPGGNITGFSTIAVDLAAKRLEMLKEALPNLSRVAILVNPNDPDVSRRSIEETKPAADRLGITLEVIGASDLEQIKRAFSLIADGGFGGVIVVQDGAFFRDRGIIAELAIANRVPTMVWANEPAEAGALMSYGPSYPAIFRSAAGYVEKILKGAKPADLPVQQPTTFELIINLKTAKSLNIVLPPALILRADKVFE